jgi:hypothetical protein
MAAGARRRLGKQMTTAGDAGTANDSTKQDERRWGQ